MSYRPRFLLAFDADCGQCTSFKGLVSFLDLRHNLDYISLSDADERGVLQRLPERKRYSSAHLVSPDGTIFSGADAIPRILGLLPGGWLSSRLTGGCGLGRTCVRFLYRTASRLHDTGDCGTGKKGG
ncbi:MAG: DUF393 domain-containing protein [Nitrososphaerota archaeon]|nr:DUF393 domain-containing protein [Nitrososphaerota archaeon]